MPHPAKRDRKTDYQRLPLAVYKKNKTRARKERSMHTWWVTWYQIIFILSPRIVSSLFELFNKK
jgi:hypothetical protein